MRPSSTRFLPDVFTLFDNPNIKGCIDGNIVVDNNNQGSQFVLLGDFEGLVGVAVVEHFEFGLVVLGDDSDSLVRIIGVHI